MRLTFLSAGSGSLLRPIDLVAALVVGEGIACLAVVIFPRVEIRLLPAISARQEHILLVVMLPLLAAVGIGIAGFLSRWAPWLFQAGKFCLIGVLNTAVDFGVLNLLISYFDATHGALYSLCKAASFGTAVVNSYVWNRFWTFAPVGPMKAQPVRTPSYQLPRFLAVTLVGAWLNVTVASLVVNWVKPASSLAAIRWANLAAVCGLVVSATWDFLAYRYFVFAHRPVGAASPSSPPDQSA